MTLIEFYFWLQKNIEGKENWDLMDLSIQGLQSGESIYLGNDGKPYIPSKDKPFNY